MARPRIETGKTFNALVISEKRIVNSIIHNRPPVAEWIQEKARNERTVYSRIRRRGQKVIFLYEAGSKKHNDILQGKFTTWKPGRIFTNKSLNL